MRGQADVGFIQARNEVEPHGEGYRGIIVIPLQGHWQTPTVDTKPQAQILLDALRAKLFPKPTESGLSQATQDAMAKGLAAIKNY